MRGSLFPLFWWSMSFHLVKTWATKIGEIGTHFTQENAERVPISPAKTMRGSLFPLFWWSMSWQDEKTWTTKIGEIGTLSWFWHFTLRGNRGNRDPLIVSCCILTSSCQDMDHQNRGNRDPLMVLALHP